MKSIPTFSVIEAELERVAALQHFLLEDAARTWLCDRGIAWTDFLSWAPLFTVELHVPCLWNQILVCPDGEEVEIPSVEAAC